MAAVSNDIFDAMQVDAFQAVATMAMLFIMCIYSYTVTACQPWHLMITDHVNVDSPVKAHYCFTGASSFKSTAHMHVFEPLFICLCFCMSCDHKRKKKQSYHQLPCWSRGHWDSSLAQALLQHQPAYPGHQKPAQQALWSSTQKLYSPTSWLSFQDAFLHAHSGTKILYLHLVM